ncbi:MAG: adenosine deaminase [Candidatus Eremiobacteraeota bacterium]|nr:adenosine deaminase [Candidatus Eremiobacteraeota bacterium]
MMTVLESLRKLPKVQLHCHLEGTVRPQTFAELATRYGVPTEYRPDATSNAVQVQLEGGSIYRFSGFREFLYKFAAVCRSLQKPDDYARALTEYADDAAANGVMYAELFVSPSAWRFFHPALDIEGVFKTLSATATTIRKRNGQRIRFIWDITRNFGIKNAIESAQQAVLMRKYDVVAIGLGGDEANFPAYHFEEAFRIARDGGLRAVAHAGEGAGAHSVRDAIEILGAERIGHGIRATESAEVIDLVKQRNVTLEICPTSNFRTGVAAEDRRHPIHDLHSAGIRLMIDSDDPAIFETDLTREYAYAESLLGMDAVLTFANQAVQASFADPGAKAEMTQKLQTASAELFTNRRS